MAPIKTKESLMLLASLTSLAPFLSPVKGVILLIAQAVEEVNDNTNQCIYLLRRCTHMCLHVDELYSEKGIKDSRKPLEEFKHALDKIRLCVEHLSKKTALQRFLQRQEISESIKEGHRCLDGCLELFQLQATSSLAFAVTEHEAARQRDQAQLGKTLEQLLTNDASILDALELRGDEILEAVRGLRDTVSRGIDDAIQKNFATKSLKTLLEEEAKFHSSLQVTSYDWAVSSLEILIEGEILGSGAFGTVYIGRWNGARVAVKQLAKGTPRQMLIREIDIWRRLQHPHVASFFRACIDATPPLLVSEMYTSGNVMDHLSTFPDADRINLCYEISLGMDFLHNQRIVHGDLKPANVLIDGAHRARITDFGLSKIKSSMTTQTVADVSERTQARTPGTRAFMAPERLRRGTMNYATDVYAFAMSTYQILTGDAPFQHLPEDDLRQVVVVECGRPERPEGPEFVAQGLTTPVWDLVEHCWADDRQKRPKFDEICRILKPLNKRPTDPHTCLKQAATPPTTNTGHHGPLSTFAEAADVETDSGCPLSIPGTDVVISAADFKMDRAPGFGIPSRSFFKALPPLPPSDGGVKNYPQKSRLTSDPPSSREPGKAPSPEHPPQDPSKESKPTTRETPSWYKRLSLATSATQSQRTKRVSSTKPQPQSKAKTKVEKKWYDGEFVTRIRDGQAIVTRLKFVVVGDGACGKTHLLYAFSKGRFPELYIPTVFETYVAEVSIAGHGIELALWDTAGQDGYDMLRPMSYPDAHVFLICFAVTSPESFENVQEKWIKEVRHFGPDTPVLLVGCKSDLRASTYAIEELRRLEMEPVTLAEAEATAEAINAVCYVECSALKGDGVREVFRTATTCGLGSLLKEREKKRPARSKGCIIT